MDITSYFGRPSSSSAAAGAGAGNRKKKKKSVNIRDFAVRSAQRARGEDDDAEDVSDGDSEAEDRDSDGEADDSIVDNDFDEGELDADAEARARFEADRSMGRSYGFDEDEDEEDPFESREEVDRFVRAKVSSEEESDGEEAKISTLERMDGSVLESDEEVVRRAKEEVLSPPLVKALVEWCLFQMKGYVSLDEASACWKLEQCTFKPSTSIADVIVAFKVMDITLGRVSDGFVDEPMYWAVFGIEDIRQFYETVLLRDRLAILEKKYIIISMFIVTVMNMITAIPNDEKICFDTLSRFSSVQELTGGIFDTSSSSAAGEVMGEGEVVAAAESAGADEWNEEGGPRKRSAAAGGGAGGRRTKASLAEDPLLHHSMPLKAIQPKLGRIAEAVLIRRFERFYSILKCCIVTKINETNHADLQLRHQFSGLSSLTRWGLSGVFFTAHKINLGFIIEHISADMLGHGIKLEGGCMWMPVLTEEGFFTHSYQRMKRDDGETMMIDDYVAFVMTERPHPSKVYTEAYFKRVAGITDTVRRKMLECGSHIIPRMNVNRSCFAFRNCIADFSHGHRKERVYVYDITKVRKELIEKYPDNILPMSSIPTDLMACVFHDNYVSIEEMFDEVTIENPSTIRCRFFKHLFGHQGYFANSENEEQAHEFAVICAMLGRWFFELGRWDNLHIVPWFLGVGGTGKTTVVDILERCYPLGRVGKIGDNIESTFGLAPVIEMKYFSIIANEIGRDFGMRKEDFLRLVSGESITAPSKGRDPIVVERWKIPIAYTGNEMPARWVDSQGQISRRILVFKFWNKALDNLTRLVSIAEVDEREYPDDDDEYGVLASRTSDISLKFQERVIKREVGNIIFMMNRHYLAFAEAYKGITDIYGRLPVREGETQGRLIIPPKFHVFRDELRAMQNNAIAFLTVSNRFDKEDLGNKNLYMSFQTFVEWFKSFCTDTNRIVRSIDISSFEFAFSQFGIEYVAKGPPLVWNGAQVTSYIRGCTLSDISLREMDNLGMYLAKKDRDAAVPSDRYIGEGRAEKARKAAEGGQTLSSEDAAVEFARQIESSSSSSSNRRSFAAAGGGRRRATAAAARTSSIEDDRIARSMVGPLERAHLRNSAEDVRAAEEARRLAVARSDAQDPDSIEREASSSGLALIRDPMTSAASVVSASSRKRSRVSASGVGAVKPSSIPLAQLTDED